MQALKDDIVEQWRSWCGSAQPVCFTDLIRLVRDTEALGMAMKEFAQRHLGSLFGRNLPVWHRLEEVFYAKQNGDSVLAKIEAPVRERSAVFTRFGSWRTIISRSMIAIAQRVIAC